MSRLLHAVEEAKKRLSFEPYAQIREEHLAEHAVVPVHLDLEVSRSEYEQLIRHLIEGLSRVAAGNEILCRMDLDLDGILRVTAIEKRTGLATHITIEGATTALAEDDIAQARRRTAALFGDLDEEELDADAVTVEAEVPAAGERRDSRVWISEARALLERSRRLLDQMTAEDREEAIALHEQLEATMHTQDWDRLRQASAELADLLFYVEEG